MLTTQIQPARVVAAEQPPPVAQIASAQEYQTEVLRNCERCARQPRGETLAQFFENFVEKANNKISEGHFTSTRTNKSMWITNEEAKQHSTPTPTPTNADQNQSEKENVDPNWSMEGPNETMAPNVRARPRQPTVTPLKTRRQKTDQMGGDSNRE